MYFLLQLSKNYHKILALSLQRSKVISMDMTIPTNIFSFQRKKEERSDRILNYKAILGGFSLIELSNEIDHLVGHLKKKSCNDVYVYMSKVAIEEIESRYTDINKSSSQEIQAILTQAKKAIESFSLI